MRGLSGNKGLARNAGLRSFRYRRKGKRQQAVDRPVNRVLRPAGEKLSVVESRPKLGGSPRTVAP